MARHGVRGEGSSPAALLLDELEEGSSRRELALEAGDLGLSDSQFRFAGPVQVELRINRSAQTFLVEGRIHWRISGECCRCLEPVEQGLEASLRLLLQRQQASAEGREAASEDEDVEILAPGAKQADLKERLREAVLLELPMRVYCRADCQGLCPQCGHNRNRGSCGCAPPKADPRWEALNKLKFS